jgi:hypothetical protein
MKAIVAVSVCCIVLSLADRVLFDGRLAVSLPLFLKAVARGFLG